MTNRNLITQAWADYELLDSGDNRKLERFGKFIVIRPETQAIWQPINPAAWKQANAEFRFTEGGKGGWAIKKNIPETWELSWRATRGAGGAKFTARLGSFKHLGIFPEQAANWEWIAERVEKISSARGAAAKVLNLFGYTGIASIVAAQAGAQVTHVDASKQSNEWARENATLSGVTGDGSAPGTGSIRYLLDDALKFVEREMRRAAATGAAKYDGIILDPPAFGRGAKGEVWHIEEGLPRLLASLAKLLSDKPGSFFLLNGYAAGYSPQSFAQAVGDVFPDGEFGELQIAETKHGGGGARVIPSGIYVRFVRGAK